MYERQRDVVARGQQHDRPRRGQTSRGRSKYNSERVESYRQTQSLITEGDLAEDLKKKLFPGIKTESVMDRLEAVQTFKAVTLCITTRAIGFGVVNIFISLFEFSNVPIRDEITQFYRVCSAIVQTKVALTQRGVSAIMDCSCLLDLN